MTVVASYGMVLCGNSDDVNHRYRGRIEKVKFGVPINEAFAHDIPATLLVLLLKLNKEGPYKKDIWRAPGNQAQVRKLSHIMQHGRLVNIANFSVYTAASVIKKFLSKLPGGIFGIENEQILMDNALTQKEADKQRQGFYRIFCSLPPPSQHLLVLLFGTFKMVADNADSCNTKMNPDAIAISVAPSLFHSCIHDGRQVKLEDVQRFKTASNVVRTIITSFGHTNLFPRECYEFYARITGRTLRVDENWLFSFQYPSSISSPSAFSVMAAKCAGAYSLAALHLEPDPSNRCSVLLEDDEASRSGTGSFSHPEVVVSSALVEEDEEHQEPECSTSRSIRPYHQQEKEERPSCLAARLSNRLSSSVGEVLNEHSDVDDGELEAPRPLTACAGDAGGSLSYLQWVHENQARRMKSRSEWFLSPVMTKGCFKSEDFSKHSMVTSTSLAAVVVVAQIENVEKIEPTRAERQASIKTRTPLQKRSSTGSTQINIAGWSSPTIKPQPAAAPPTAVTRRRSWRTHFSNDNSTVKTHSLDSEPAHVGSPDSRGSADATHSAHASSLGGERWTNDVISDEVPKKRRSLKKKHSTQF